MAYGLGFKVISSLCKAQDPMLWYRAKLNPSLFSANELEAFSWTAEFLKSHHALPHPDTIAAKFADIAQVEVKDPPSYYIKMLENQYFHKVLNDANLKSQDILNPNKGGDQENHEQAMHVLQNAIKVIKEQKYRNKLLDVGEEASDLVLKTYHSKGLFDGIAKFNWPYLDAQTTSLLPGEVVSIIGKTGLGKTFACLWIAIQNWKQQESKKGENVLFISMEMAPLPIAQRVTSMYSQTPISQLKNSGFSNVVYKKFVESMNVLIQEEAKFFVVDGNLAATVEDIYILADMLECKIVVIDGAYLVKHPNSRLDRFTRVAENAELIKRHTEDISGVTFASWQFSRDASKKKKTEDDIGLEDIGLSASIEQVSSVVLGFFQEEGIETLVKRKIRVMKGRSGETGSFMINWLFESMNFTQCYPLVEGEEEHPKELLWL